MNDIKPVWERIQTSQVVRCRKSMQSFAHYQVLTLKFPRTTEPKGYFLQLNYNFQVTPFPPLGRVAPVVIAETFS